LLIRDNFTHHGAAELTDAKLTVIAQFITFSPAAAAAAAAAVTATGNATMPGAASFK